LDRTLDFTFSDAEIAVLEASGGADSGGGHCAFRYGAKDDFLVVVVTRDPVSIESYPTKQMGHVGLY
jgi:hypothetical protein